jgi:CRISPR system Cascade subunit CasA
VRPAAGRALWRDFATLFLKETERATDSDSIRPSVLEQVDALALQGVLPRDQSRTFRCIGLRTDMKAKVFESAESGFDVPLTLLGDRKASLAVRQGVGFAEDVAALLRRVFRRYFASGRSDRSRTVLDRLLALYWENLGLPFRTFVLREASESGKDELLKQWLQEVVATAQRQLDRSTDQVGSTARTLLRRAEAISSFAREAASLRNKVIQEG